MSFLMPEHFNVIAGEAVVERIRASRKSIERTASGFFDSESLVNQQREEAQAGIVGAELVRTRYGTSVRYDSGLQGFGLLARARDLGGTEEAAIKFAQTWVAADPERRYAWMRK